MLALILAMIISLAIQTTAVGQQDRMVNTQQEAITPKPTPSPTASFCVNKVTGVMRLVLAEAGISQPCHKNELPITFTTLAEIASGSPTPTPSASPTPTESPTSSASPTASPTATPITGSVPIVVDANGKLVGPVVGPYPAGSPSGEVYLVAIKVNGTVLELPASQSGFMDGDYGGTPNLYGGITEYYLSTGDCTGQAYISLSVDDLWNGGFVETIGVTPLVEASIHPGVGPQIWDGILYYGAAPFINAAWDSSQSGNNPTSVSNCVQSAGGSEILAPLTSIPVSSLGFTPPFSIQ
jgi:hypothetical protein